MSKEATFSDYGHQKGLQEILEELSFYCSVNFVDAKDNEIKLVLPKKVFDKYRE